jgi:4-hydroxy-tetrahydrodipicolinate synthase
MSFCPKGIIPPVITPFNEDGTVNYAVYRKFINYLIDEGVHGIFPLGTTGEFYAVSDDEYERILRVTVEEVNGRVDIYAGANDITTRGVVRLTKICEKIKGIDALSVLTPMFVSQSQKEVFAYYKTIAESTSLPIVMYNNKPKTNVTIEPATVAELAKIPNIIGIKDSTGDFGNTIDYIRLTAGNPNFHVLIGKDTLIFPALTMGASGAIASCANVAPKLLASIYNKFVDGDVEGARAAQLQLTPLRLACNMGTFPAAIKECLVQMGIPVGKCLAPIGEMLPEEKEKLGKVLRELKLV